MKQVDCGHQRFQEDCLACVWSLVRAVEKHTSTIQKEHDLLKTDMDWMGERVRRVETIVPVLEKCLKALLLVRSCWSPLIGKRHNKGCQHLAVKDEIDVALDAAKKWAEKMRPS